MPYLLRSRGSFVAFADARWRRWQDQMEMPVTMRDFEAAVAKVQVRQNPRSSHASHMCERVRQGDLKCFGCVGGAQSSVSEADLQKHMRWKDEFGAS